MANLEKLDLSYCSTTTDKFLEDVNSSCPNLKNLCLISSKCNFKHLGEFKKLISLNVSRTDIKEEELIKALVANPNLKYLNIGKIDFVKDDV